MLMSQLDQAALTVIKVNHWEGFSPSPVFEGYGLKSIIWIILVILSLIVGVGIKGIFIKYCCFHAPEGRPLNIMIALDQVRFPFFRPLFPSIIVNYL